VPPGCRLFVGRRSFWRLCAANRDLRLEREASGELVIMAPAGSETGHRNAGVTGQLWAWSRDDGTGLSFDSSTGFTLPNGKVCSPDASWVLKGRWEALAVEQREKFAPICPDFVVELRSSSNEMTDLRVKMLEYLEQGIRLGWLLDPKNDVVEIYRPGRPVEILKRPQTLSGEDVLPGFVLDLRGIFFD
jgi:Uma2 family endonuclease